MNNVVLVKNLIIRFTINRIRYVVRVFVIIEGNILCILYKHIIVNVFLSNDEA